MRVLFLTQVLPYPLTSGARIRAYYMLRKLAEQHTVTLVSFVRPEDCSENIEHLRSFLFAVHVVPMQRARWRDALAFAEGMLPGRSIVIARDRLGSMRRLLRQLTQDGDFDIVHADQTAMAQYALYARTVGRRRPRIVLDQHNALYRVVERQAATERNDLSRTLWRHEARQLRRYEAGLMRAFDHILTVAAEDLTALSAVVPSTERQAVARKVTLLPICVDPEADGQAVKPVDAGPQILHLGTMFWPPNAIGVLWFAEHVMPLVVAAVPHACFTIAGKDPPASVRALAELGAALASHICVTGFVADPAPLLARCRAFVVPLLAGGGMRVKIVDAWQWGVPVVTTTIGAEGIDVQHGINVLVADDPADFANNVIMLLNDASLRERLRQNGFAHVRAEYNWRTRYSEADAIYRQLAGMEHETV